MKILLMTTFKQFTMTTIKQLSKILLKKNNLSFWNKNIKNKHNTFKNILMVKKILNNNCMNIYYYLKEKNNKNIECYIKNLKDKKNKLKKN